MPNYLKAYRMSSNIPGMTGEAMYEEIFDPVLPGLVRRSVDFFNGGHGHRSFRDFEMEALQTASFRSQTYFRELRPYQGLRYLGNDRDGEAISFTFRKVYEPDDVEPGEDALEPELIVLEDCRVVSAPMDPIAGQDGGQYQVNLWCYSWKAFAAGVEDDSALLHHFENRRVGVRPAGSLTPVARTRIFRSYVLDGAGNRVMVDHWAAQDAMLGLT